MSATSAGAIKAYLEAQSLGISVYRDQAPATDIARPYCTVQEAIAVTPSGWEGGDYVVTEMVQMDLWQNWRRSDQTTGENYALPGDIAALLHGTRLLQSGSGAPPETVIRVRVQMYRRMPMTQEMVDDNITQHSYTLLVHRNPG